VRELCDRFGVSERRACRSVCQHRSSQRYCRTRISDEAALREQLKALAIRHPRYGYRRIHVLLVRDGWCCNRKRIQRLWRDEGLRVPVRTRRRRRGRRAPVDVVANHPDHVWAMDFEFDQTREGRPIKILNITDEFTRECLISMPARAINADRVVSVLEDLLEWRATPGFIRCDNGPELVAEGLKDWCRFTGVTTSYIEPGAPWQNAYVESFNGHLRREFLELESFDTLFEAKVLIEDWRLEYNHYRPHMSLNYQTPAEFARNWRTDHQHIHPLS
jgi:transposase InsO family protein